ncbi:MAG: phosphoribosylanthranilate isomerase [Sheuella sp.]|nr:phosphoribosylanthranilate isomerase [Sheuella sp.]
MDSSINSYAPDISPRVRTRIKICGFTRAQDIRTAVDLGVDALGFVFYPPSKRYVTPAQAGALCSNIPAFVSTVALFVNAARPGIEAVIDAMRPTVLQFHGDESPEECASYGLPFLRAFRVGAPDQDTPKKLADLCAQFDRAAGWIFDSYSPAYGGSGLAFDYALLSELAHLGERARPLILSGGLKQDTVVQSINLLRPWAVDVSSGVEEAPGIKSALKMREFVRTVNSC